MSTSTTSSLSSLPADVASGSGTATDPYVLESYSGTLTLEAGKFYVVESGVTIGVAATVSGSSNTSANNASGGIVVNGAYLQINVGASVSGTVDISASGSSVYIVSGGSYVAATYSPGKTSVGSSLYTWASVQSAVFTGLINSDGSVNTNSSLYVSVPGAWTTAPSPQLLSTYNNSTAVQSTPFAMAYYNGSTTTYFGVEAEYPASAASSSATGGTFAAHVIPKTVDSKGNEIYCGSSTPFTCFLAGALIHMADGSTSAVEKIIPGDVVLSHTGKAVRVNWVGRGRAYVCPFQTAGGQAQYPVRIAKDAIADGVPSADLCVTPEHCIFIDEALVPARMLVNGGSIAYDTATTAYTYYHIETAAHTIVFANNMPTESFLDTGAKREFVGSDNIVSITPPKNWDDAAAPLATHRSFVEPHYQALAARSEMLGYGATVHPVVTNDADLHLLTADGRIIRPNRQSNNRYMFSLPAGVEEVFVVSRTSRPSEAIGPFVDDRRQLGVLVGNVSFFGSGETVDVDAHLQSSAKGWDVTEASPCRWTNGRGQLLLPRQLIRATAMLAVEILAAGPYLEQDSTESRSALSA